MRQHWQTKHQWTQQRRRGRVRCEDQTQSAAELHRSFQCVSWQQVFPSGPGSHYIRIRFPERPSKQPRPAPAHHAQAAVDEVLQAWEQAQAQAKADQAIQASQLTDANPWLRMTRWAEYLSHKGRRLYLTPS
ncbi:uncharacterized protein Aud_002064 [Aspergillus udagawae]|uniref:Uncharacterized protein n=1 Tax=Aspergillus udagawae TaxID=91492 RepID=A0A8E0V5C7_9EURO|nr:uncharacterized protein Aud_002064 [Aspergillus udagawae]GIC94735.1 hypothetical protein Aud_002064 [Aspergillus udagawae]